MPARDQRQGPDQPGLFDSATPAARAAGGKVGRAPLDPDHARVASRLPSTVHLGTSSWSFPGWGGFVYDRVHSESELARHGLPAYARHPLFRTVGLDRAYYAPLSTRQYAELAADVPPGFRFLVKTHQAVTRPDVDASPGQPRGLFLSASYTMDKVLEPAVRGLGAACGPVVVQFSPLTWNPRGPAALRGPEAFVDALAAFLDRLPRVDGGPIVAVELRNRDVLGERYAAALAAGNAVHAYAGHPSMPGFAEQGAIIPPGGQAAIVARWLLRPGLSYDGAKDRYFPFTALVDEDPVARGAIAELVMRGAGRPAFVIVNNKAEGSAPRSVFALAREIAKTSDGPQARDAAPATLA
jgi:uncharacterized protein YecE (DUF72 family)